MGLVNAVLYVLVGLYIVPPALDRAVDVLYQDSGPLRIGSKPAQPALPSPSGQAQDFYGFWKASIAAFYHSRDYVVDGMTEPVAAAISKQVDRAQQQVVKVVLAAVLLAATLAVAKAGAKYVLRR